MGMEEEVMGIGETEEGTATTCTAGIGTEGTGIVGTMIGIETMLHIASVTWAQFRVHVELRIPLLAILIHVSHPILLHINHTMPEVAFNPCPRSRMEVREGV